MDYVGLLVTFAISMVFTGAAVTYMYKRVLFIVNRDLSYIRNTLYPDNFGARTLKKKSHRLRRRKQSTEKCYRNATTGFTQFI